MLNLQNIEYAKSRLDRYDPNTFGDANNSFRFFLNKLKVHDFRHIKDLELIFNHPITVITGTNKVGKTSILLLIACSHENFKKYDSTKPETDLRNHSWGDVLSFTQHETMTRDYYYELFWRVGDSRRSGWGKRTVAGKKWNGLGKLSSDLTRINAKIREKEVRLIDLERLLPVRNFSNSLIRKITAAAQERLHEDVERAFSYILDIPDPVQIHKIGSHINKVAYLISPAGAVAEPYSSYNAASGEESLINILIEIIETPGDSLILIDEIEAGLHPSVQRKLANVIQYISWHHKKQFIVTTHSPSLLSAFSQGSRKFIEKRPDGTFNTISKISVNTAFSKMDAKAYPLVQLYCEDDEAKFIINNIMLGINERIKYFDRLVNIVTSGGINEVKNDYERHKRNYDQLRLKLGYCAVFDGDCKNDPKYSSYHRNSKEFSFFLYPYQAPEKFLVRAYLNANPNEQLATAFTFNDHHALFQEMVILGLAHNTSQALQLCWESFKTTPEFSKLKDELEKFLIKTTTYFSYLSDSD